MRFITYARRCDTTRLWLDPEAVAVAFKLAEFHVLILKMRRDYEVHVEEPSVVNNNPDR